MQPESVAKVFGKDEATATAVLDDALRAFSECPWDSQTLHEATTAIGEAHGWKLGKTTGPIRVATTGRHVGPPLFESLEVLGRERTLERLKDARSRL
jgi:glutamyl-tRNA synthetase